MPGVPKTSFVNKVLLAVLGGASTADEVYAKVANQISASRAMIVCRARDEVEARRVAKGCRRGTGRPQRTTREALARGRRHIVADALGGLVRVGKIRRVGVGRYAPPLPKIHDAEAG